jgi:hypothetical protein
MKRLSHKAVFLLHALLLSSASASADDWIFDNGPYTRNPKTGERVDQYKALPKIDRIPFEKYFSEDGPHPFGMDYWLGDWGWGGGYGGYGLGYGGEMFPYTFGDVQFTEPFFFPLDNGW